MKEFVIVDAVRTPVGNQGGMLRDVDTTTLAQTVMQGLIERNKLDAGLITEVIFGNVFQSSNAPNIARVATLKAGIPQHVPAYTVARNCDSGMDAIISAWRVIQVGEGDMYMAGGTESMSNVPYLVRGARWCLKMRHSQFTDALWEGLTRGVAGYDGEAPRERGGYDSRVAAGGWSGAVGAGGVVGEGGGCDELLGVADGDGDRAPRQ